VVDEISPEGHHLRKLHDLKLVRARSPLFRLTWTVMHEIDEHSPLHGTDWDAPANTVFAFIVTLTGHDSTYGQTTYARHNYSCDDLQVDHRFVDIISELPDGRMMVDYTKFHDTVADAVSEHDA